MPWDITNQVSNALCMILAQKIFSETKWELDLEEISFITNLLLLGVTLGSSFFVLTILYPVFTLIGRLLNVPLCLALSGKGISIRGKRFSVDKTNIKIKLDNFNFEFILWRGQKDGDGLFSRSHILVLIWRLTIFNYLRWPRGPGQVPWTACAPWSGQRWCPQLGQKSRKSVSWHKSFGQNSPCLLNLLCEDSYLELMAALNLLHFKLKSLALKPFICLNIHILMN